MLPVPMGLFSTHTTSLGSMFQRHVGHGAIKSGYMFSSRVEWNRSIMHVWHSRCPHTQMQSQALTRQMEHVAAAISLLDNCHAVFKK